jgi:hypothetical protein
VISSVGWSWPRSCARRSITFYPIDEPADSLRSAQALAGGPGWATGCCPNCYSGTVSAVPWMVHPAGFGPVFKKASQTTTPVGVMIEPFT